MRLSTAFLPVTGAFVLATGVQLESKQNPNLVPASLDSRSPDPDLGDILEDLPALISDIVSTGISIAKALKEAVKNDALVRNDLGDVLGNTPNVTSLVPEPTETPSDNQLEARQDQNNKAPGTASCPDVAILYAKGAKEPGMCLNAVPENHTRHLSKSGPTDHVLTPQEMPASSSALRSSQPSRPTSTAHRPSPYRESTTRLPPSKAQSLPAPTRWPTSSAAPWKHAPTHA